MEQKYLINAIIAVSLAGAIFSGYLSLIELSGKGMGCPAVSQIIGVPSCAYGFVMFGAILGLGVLLLKEAKK